MAITVLPSLHERCAENIALLHHLGNIPSPPRRNLVRDPGPDPATTRTLSIGNESDLTSVLAFLSSIRDDPNKVTAVCIEESVPGLVVMIAVNAEGLDASTYIQSVKAGFDTIFTLLRTASITSRETLQEQVLSSIISMCRSRILSRARLIGKGSRPTIEKYLLDTSAGIRQLPGVENKKNFLRICRELTEILKLYRELPCQTDQSEKDKYIKRIIDLFCYLDNVPNLDDILLKKLDLATPRMDTDSRRALLNTIKEMAMHKTSASILIKLARKHAIVRRATTLIVTLDAAAVSRPVVANSDATLTTVLQRIANTYRTAWNMISLPNALSEKLKKLPKDFVGELNRLRTGSKIHAEIQLIWYLDGYQSRNPPRVIASNKDACYLCNAFITLQGKYTIPGTHGRLYPGWRLPSTRMQHVDERFVVDLEHKIVERVNWILGKSIGPPLESTVPTIMGSMTTVSTRDEESLLELEGSDSGDTVVPEPISLEPEARDAQTQTTPPLLPVETVISEAGNGNHSIVSSLQPLLETEEQPTIRQDESRWQRIKQGKTKHLGLTNVLDLYIEYTSQPPVSGRTTLKFRISKLSSEEKAAAMECEQPLYDLESLEEVNCGHNCRVVNMRLGEDVFRVNLDGFVGITVEDATRGTKEGANLTCKSR
ncbi:Fc.00g062200.m01.CDS01 [Cosmosporella sp. VM-42]